MAQSGNVNVTVVLFEDRGNLSAIARSRYARCPMLEVQNSLCSAVEAAVGGPIFRFPQDSANIAAGVNPLQKQNAIPRNQARGIEAEVRGRSEHSSVV